jgi:hypothetical protein
MVEPEPTQPAPSSVPPFHDPWAATVPVPGPGAFPPVPAPVSGPGDPPTTRYPYPGLVPEYPSAEQVVAQIGEIQVTATTIRTPAGNFPLQGSRWTVMDQSVTEEKIPTWAIVLAIVLFFCLTVFSLLFLLARETRQRSVVQVHVVNGPHQYVARIPAADQAQVQYLYQQVNYVRSLATM